MAAALSWIFPIFAAQAGWIQCKAVVIYKDIGARSVYVAKKQRKRKFIMEAHSAVWGIGYIIGAVVAVGVFITEIFYCATLQKAFGRVSPENRALAPGLVWLLMVPLVVNIPLSFVHASKIATELVATFGVVWQFVIVLKLAASLAAEFKKRNIAGPAAPGKTMGLVMCILSACASLFSFLALVVHPVGLLAMLMGIVGFVFWIIYWVKISGFSNKLAAPAA
jgi:uncharacterized membrane protein